ncbi:MAG: hypothetical protein WC326_14365 [Candidatus Delongbacteria bacterium]
MRFIWLAALGIWLAASRPAQAQCMDLTVPDTLSYTIQVPEISLANPVSRKFYYEAYNPNILDELLFVHLVKNSGPAIGDWRYQWCEDPATDPHAQCRPIQPWETEFSIHDTLYSEDGSLYDVEFYAIIFGSAELELTLTREFCPETVVHQVLNVTVEQDSGLAEWPTDLELQAAWPNPFNPLAHIPFHLERAGAVRVDVYDLNGRLVGTPLLGSLPAGRHEALFDGSGLPSGRYTYCVRTEDSSLSAPLTLIK